mgnify:CR=1 FL=1
MRRDDLTDRFRALHVPGRPFVMPNPWDIGSARVMAGLGAPALATTSSGHGFTLGLPGLRQRRDFWKLAVGALAAISLTVLVSHDW